MVDREPPLGYHPADAVRIVHFGAGYQHVEQGVWEHKLGDWDYDRKHLPAGVCYWAAVPRAAERALWQAAGAGGGECVFLSVADWVRPGAID